MSPRMKVRSLFAVALVGFAMLLPAMPASAKGEKRIQFNTKSKEAVEYAMKVVNAIETFQFGPPIQALAKKSVELDPNFAFGQYLVATFAATPEEGAKEQAKCVELLKNASDGERRYIEAVFLVRAQKQAEALPIFEELAKQYPDERMVQMLLGQIRIGEGKRAMAVDHFKRAIAIDGSTPRAYSFIGQVELIDGNYAKAREYFNESMKRRAPNSAPFGPYTGLAWSYVYEGNYDKGIEILEQFKNDYVKSGGSTAFPEVFIWNSIARLHLESGRPEQAIKEYEAGYATVPGSTIDDQQKQIWLGRLHHGKGRAFARMGKADDAWKEAQTIKTMIENGGEPGKQFWPSYHYIAGYLKYEAGDYKTAVDEMKQANMDDQFHRLVLARAYEKIGDQENAQKLYKEIVTSNDLSLERALAFPEAKKKLKTS